MALPPPPKKDPKSAADAQEEAKKALMDVVPKHAAPAAAALLPPKEPADDDITKGAPRAIIVAEPGEDAPQEETKATPADAASVVGPPAPDELTPAGSPAPAAPPVPDPAAFVGPPDLTAATREEEKARKFAKDQENIDHAALNRDEHYQDQALLFYLNTPDVGKAMDKATIESFLKLHNGGDLPPDDDGRRLLMQRVSGELFEGRGAENEEEFLRQIVKGAQGRKDAKDYQEHQQMYLKASAALMIADPKGVDSLNFEAYLDEARKLPGHRPEDEVAMEARWVSDRELWKRLYAPRVFSIRSIVDSVDGDTPEARTAALRSLTSKDSPIQMLMQQHSPRPTRVEQQKAFEQMLKDNLLFPAFTSAAHHAVDKRMFRNPDGSWNLPYLKKVDGWKSVLTTPTLGPTQSMGARNDLWGANNDPEGTQAVFRKFQKDNNLSDSEMVALWNDNVNVYRPWDENEKVRVLSDGVLLPNMNESAWLDTEAAIKIIRTATAPEDTKTATLLALGEIQSKIALERYKAYSAAAMVQNISSWILSPSQKAAGASPDLMHPEDWAKKNGRTDLYTPRFILDYEKEVIKDRPWLLQKGWGLQIDVAQGGMAVVSSVGGIIGSMGSDTITNASKDLQELSEQADKGQPNTGMIGKVAEQAVPVTVDLLLTKGAGRGGTLLFRSSAGATKFTQFVTLPILAGSRTYGDQYIKELRSGAKEEQARANAGRAALASVIISVSSAGVRGEWKNAVPPEKMTVGMLLQGDSREQVIGNLKRFSSEMFGSLEPAMREEAMQQLSSSFLNVKPDTNLAEAWDNYIESLGAAMATKGLGEIADRSGPAPKADSTKETPDTILPPAFPADITGSKATSTPPPLPGKAATTATADAPSTPATKAPPEAKGETKVGGKEVKPTAKTEKGTQEKSTAKAGTNTKPKPAPKPTAKKTESTKTTKPKAKPAAEKPATPKKQTKKKKKNPRPKRGDTKKLRYGRENKPDEE